MTPTNTKIADLQAKINYQFKNLDLLKTALTHRSTLNQPQITQSYERLEFLGDAVLEMLISRYLFDQLPDKDEGYLTTARSVVVRTQSLATLAQKLTLNQYIIMSHGEEISGGRDNLSILEDVVESLIGAIYLDGGLEAARNFFDTHFIPHSKKMLETNQLKDSKSLLQEKLQAKGEKSPLYKTIEEKGPDHKKTFTVAAIINGKEISTGTGKNKQVAEQQAAKKALKLI